MTILEFLQKKQKHGGYGHDHDRFKDGLIDHYDGLYKEQYFCDMLSIERKRSERSRKPFFLLLVDLRRFNDRFERHEVAKKVGEALSPVTRDTDIKGWYQYGSLVGVIFTEVGVHEKTLKITQKHLTDKCENVFSSALSEFEHDKIVMMWHVFPGKFDKFFSDQSGHTKVYPDIFARIARKRPSLFVKRMIDIVGSGFALILFAAVYLVIAVIIKLTSEGPVFFRQERVGQFGKRFIFFKFRSMYTNNDPTIHKDFVQSLIRGEENQTGDKSSGNLHGAYKITKDPRVTSVGRFLRKTSLDELPQFFNVFRGDMSLVGPRPPIPYECNDYDIWHRRRVLEMKPGITGLWQVKGRSSTTFDEMVRMDIQYIEEWSLWMDIKILLQTPGAVLSGKGAY